MSEEVHRLAQKRYYQQHKDYYKQWREVHKQQQRQWWLDHREKHKEYNRKRMQEYPEKIREFKRNYRKRNPEKTRVRNKALRLPLHLVCEFCEASENLEHHHPDYDYPLMFVTCCKLCHEWIHHYPFNGD